jgi:hypothetical protein
MTTTTMKAGTDGMVGLLTERESHGHGRFGMVKMKITTRNGRRIDGSGDIDPGPGVRTVGRIKTSTRDIRVFAVMVSLLLSANMTDGVGVGLLMHIVQVTEGNPAGVAVIHLPRDIVHWMRNTVTLGTMIPDDQSDIVVGTAIALRNRDDTPFQLHLNDALDLLLCHHQKAQILGNGSGLSHQSMHWTICILNLHILVNLLHCVRPPFLALQTKIEKQSFVASLRPLVELTNTR